MKKRLAPQQHQERIDDPHEGINSGGTKGVDGIGRGDTTYALCRETEHMPFCCLAVANESNERESNHPTARNNIASNSSKHKILLIIFDYKY